jgi:hypothetical protein
MVLRGTFDFVTIHVCGSDGQLIGEFEEEDFRENIFASRFPADVFYWHEGMADWRAIAEYRALAKTQRISFAPPMRRTIRIDMDAAAESNPKTPAKPEGAFGRFWKRLTRTKGK